MGKSIKLRQEMENSMTILQNRLESWTKTLSSAGGKLYIGDNKSTKKKTIIKIVKKKDNKEEKQNDSIKN
jgi:L-lactate utilization protein LutB